MSTRRLWIVILAFATTCLSGPPADAGLGDWLFGRTTPYAAGYAPYATAGGATVTPIGTPQPVGAANTTFPAFAQTFDNPSVYTGRPVVSRNAGAFQLPPGGTSVPLAATGIPGDLNAAFRPSLDSTQVPQPTLAPGGFQQPALAQTQFAQPLPTPLGFQPPAFTSPGIGSGLTFRGPNTGGEVPLASVLRGNTTSNPFYGTSNIYPNNFGGQNVARLGRLPVTAPPGIAAPSVSPLFPAAPQPVLGGLSRFFTSRLATGYNSSYYRAPITYYRPTIAVDPVTGVAATSQQACSSYVQQLQRTPFNQVQRSFQLGNGSTATAVGPLTPVGPPCSGSTCQNFAASPSYSQQPFASRQPFASQPSTFPGYGGAFAGANSGSSTREPIGGSSTRGPVSGSSTRGPVGQVSGIESPSDRVIPIPSTDQGYYRENTAPLTGRPSTDRDDVGQPRLESARPRTDSDFYRDGLYRSDADPYLQNKTAPRATVPRATVPPATVPKATAPREAVEQSSFWTKPLESKNDGPLELNAPSVRYKPEATIPSLDETPRLPPPPMSIRPDSLRDDYTYTQSGTMVRQQTPVAAKRVETNSFAPNSLAPKSFAPEYSTLRPIEAPESLKSPFPSSQTEPRVLAPALPPATRTPGVWEKRDDANTASSRISVPVREAAITREPSTTRLPTRKSAPKAKVPVIRDSGGWIAM